jgi:hypothetical protein
MGVIGSVNTLPLSASIGRDDISWQGAGRRPQPEPEDCLSPGEYTSRRNDRNEDRSVASYSLRTSRCERYAAGERFFSRTQDSGRLLCKIQAPKNTAMVIGGRQLQNSFITGVELAYPTAQAVAALVVPSPDLVARQPVDEAKHVGRDERTV